VIRTQPDKHFADHCPITRTSRGPTCTLILVKLRRLADFGAYIVIALAFAGIAILFAEYDIDPKWMALIFESALVFGCVIAFHRPRWRVLHFWTSLFVIFVAHLFLSSIALKHISHVSAFWVGFAFLIETAILVELIGRLAAIVDRRRKPQKGPDRKTPLSGQ
jgi:hypothetical protein